VTAHGAPLKRVKPDSAGAGTGVAAGNVNKKTGNGPVTSSKKPLDMTLATAMALASVNGTLPASKIVDRMSAAADEDDDAD
jgi:hypothetical protein